MKNRVTQFALFVLAFSAICGPVQAGAWQICGLELLVTDVLKRPYPQVQAKILRVSPASATVECPEIGAIVTFIPEQIDYQNPLPRRQWPKKGQSVRVDYRYLDGVCKGDGNSYACRIEHYPMGGR